MSSMLESILLSIHVTLGSENLIFLKSNKSRAIMTTNKKHIHHSLAAATIR